MIVEREGNLLESDADAVVNTVNTVGVMGKGLALQFKRAYPGNFKAYEAACRAGEVEIGRMFVVRGETIGGPGWIINFPTKQHWRGASRVEWVEAGLDNLVDTIRELGIRSIAVPPLGAGNGGLDWNSVRDLIVDKLGSLPNIEVQLYIPSNMKREVVGQPMRMSWGRATLIRLIESYAESRAATEPWSGDQGASALEIQKLMYFATMLAPKLRLRFDQGKYGPYSDQVRHLVQDMEGTFLRGYGDGASPVLNLEPIVPTKAGSEQARQLDESGSGAISMGIVRPVVSLVEGFEGPYGLELLASVHWVRTHQDRSGDASSVTANVQGWSERKGRLFTQEHVVRAMDRLDDWSSTGRPLARIATS